MRKQKTLRVLLFLFAAALLTGLLFPAAAAADQAFVSYYEVPFYVYGPEDLVDDVLTNDSGSKIFYYSDIDMDYGRDSLSHPHYKTGVLRESDVNNNSINDEAELKSPAGLENNTGSQQIDFIVDYHQQYYYHVNYYLDGVSNAPFYTCDVYGNDFDTVYINRLDTATGTGPDSNISLSPPGLPYGYTLAYIHDNYGADILAQLQGEGYLLWAMPWDDFVIDVVFRAYEEDDSDNVTYIVEYFKDTLTGDYIGRETFTVKRGTQIAAGAVDVDKFLPAGYPSGMLADALPLSAQDGTVIRVLYTVSGQGPDTPGTDTGEPSDPSGPDTTGTPATADNPGTPSDNPKTGQPLAALGVAAFLGAVWLKLRLRDKRQRA